MSVIVSSEDQTVILEKLDGLPPEYLLNELTQDQKEHWYGVKDVFQKTHLSLKAFFSGNPNPLQSLPDEEKELYGHLTDYYISLYGLIQWGWEDILSQFAQWHSDYYTEDFPFRTPGETLADIMQRDAGAQYWQCKIGRHDFKPRKMYQLRLQAKKLIEGKLSPKQMSQHEKDVKALAKPFQLFKELEIFCVNACRMGVQSRKDKLLKLKIQDYERKRENLSDLLHRHYRNMRGYAWENGKKLETVKEGGSYRPSS
ncbi:hypothetical protein [Scytonema sp. PCC 10023]|uniref:hypothetical protein n=1 Tax=Scytonema sp. PCC 10023 TaxID=1680591 RepID=UPI0039C626E3